MTVTTRDIERVAMRAKAEIDALLACAPAHADVIAAAALARLTRDLLGASAAPADAVLAGDDLEIVQLVAELRVQHARSNAFFAEVSELPAGDPRRAVGLSGILCEGSQRSPIKGLGATHEHTQ